MAETIDLARDAMRSRNKLQHVALIDDHPYANVACRGLTFKANVDDWRKSRLDVIDTRGTW